MHRRKQQHSPEPSLRSPPPSPPSPPPDDQMTQNNEQNFEAEHGGRYVSVWIAVLIILLSCCFSNSLHNEFAFDDGYAITGNDDSLARSHWSQLWVNDFWGQDITTEGSHKSYRPITVLSFRLNSLFHQYFEHHDWYEAFCTSTLNKNPLEPPERPVLRSEFFHIVNRMLHGTVSILIGLFFRRLCLMGKLSHVFGFIPLWVVASALFIIHPVHVEAVTGIVGRAELLCGLWMMIGLWFWSSIVLYTQQSIFKYLCIYIITFICVVLAVLSKETGFALPVLYCGLLFLWNTKSLRDIFYLHRRFANKFLLFNTIFWGSTCVAYIVFRRWLTVHLSVLINRQVCSFL